MRTFVGVGCCLLFGLASQSAPAQNQRLTAGSLQVLMIAPREYQQQLKSAQRAIDEGQFSEAIEKLSMLIQASEDGQPGALKEDFLIGKAGQSRYQSSVRSEAHRLLDSMPAKGRELYELQYGSTARRLVQKALSSGQLESLADVSRQYFHTSAGHAATMLLGRYYLDIGRPLAASMCFTRLAESPHAAAKFDPELSLLLAISWRMSGMPEAATETLIQLKQRENDRGSDQVVFRIGGKAVQVFDDSRDALAWLDKTIAMPDGVSAAIRNQWIMHRGNPARNASSDGSLPLMYTRWQVQVANDPDDEDILRSLIANYREENNPAIPMITPLVANDVVLMRSTSRLLGVDFKTGKRVWEFPWAKPLSMSLSEDQTPVLDSALRAKQLDERLWMDGIFGQLSSDGQIVYVVDELGYTPASYGTRTNIFPRSAFQSPDQPKTYNSLVALEVATEGKQRWRIGGVTSDDEPALAGAFFFGPPLILAGQLYVIAELRGDVNLFVLDSNTGKVLWSQQLAHVDQYNILADATRRLAGAVPSYADGVLVCPTSAGAVVAIDMANRSLLWGYQYNRLARTGHIRFNSALRSRPTSQRSRWVDSSVTIADGRVVVTPVESDQLHCLDLLSGNPIWKSRSRGSDLYVACVHEGKIVLVGKSYITGVNLSDGKQAWRINVGSEKDLSGNPAVPSGRGFLSGHHYYLPTSIELMQFDVRDGTLVEAIRTDVPLGNLVCYGDYILSLSPEHLSLLFRADQLVKIVEQRLQRDSDDPWALEHQGLLFLDEGDQDSALRSLRRAFQLYAADDERREGTKALLIDTLLEALEDNFAKNDELAVEVNSLIDRPIQREKYLRLMGQGLLEAGRPRAAFEAFLELAFMQNQAVDAALNEPTLPLLHNGSRQLLVRRDRFVRSGIEQALAKVTPATIGH